MKLLPLALSALLGAPALAASRPAERPKPTRAADRPGGPPSDPAALAQLRRGHAAFRAGDYAAATRALGGLAPRLPHTRDYVLYLAAESEFYDGHPGRARPLFDELARQKSSRLAPVAAFRAADCRWTDGDRAGAVAIYRRLLGATAEGARPGARLDRAKSNALAASGGFGTDPVVGRFRIAEQLADGAERGAHPDPHLRDRAQKAFHALHVEFPAHPLAEVAGARAAALAPPSAATSLVVAPATREERLRRADTLATDRHFDAALAELARLPADLPPALKAERDFLTGMTKYHMRRDYAGAAALLLGAEPGLSGEQAATAAFHGTRALSRVDRDDEAIAGYRRVVERYGSSHWAAEAQFRSGWLDFNRGRYRESLPPLEETIHRFGRSPFAEDAAWYVALAQVLLGNGQEALTAIDRYQRLAVRGSAGGEAGRRAQFFRARAQMLLGQNDQAKSTFADLVRKAPFSYYGLVARARLRALGAPVDITLPSWDGHLGPLPPATDPAVVRADELLSAGLDVEAGVELGRGEAALLGKLGRERGLALLFDRYPRMQAWRRAYQLAEAHGDAALAAAPTGPARVYWEAAYPRAFPDLVEHFAAPAGNPEFFVWSIMRKESGYLPGEVSYADARGLMQVLPQLGARLAADKNEEFSDEELYLPEVNVRLGARYTGALARKFRDDIPLAAGAFNAGPRPVTRWCEQYGKRPLDELVELVTYDQTREYMKRVLGIYARYHYLYRGSPFEPTLTVAGCQYDKSVRIIELRGDPGSE